MDLQAERLDLDEDLIVVWRGDGKGLQLEDFGAAGLVDDGCFHCRHFGGVG